MDVLSDRAFGHAQPLDAAERHVLADRRDGVGDRLRHRGAARVVRAEHRLGVDGGRLVERDRQDAAHQSLKVVVARDEIRLGIHLDDHADEILDRDADEAVGGHAAALLGRLCEALLAQPVDCGFDVPIGLGERVLAVHHARAGLLTQVFHEPSRDRSHRMSSLSSVSAAGPGLRR